MDEQCVMTEGELDIDFVMATESGDADVTAQGGVPAWDPSQPLPSASDGSESEATSYDAPSDPCPQVATTERQLTEQHDYVVPEEVVIHTHTHTHTHTK
jgi:hypothetical protein